MNVSDAWCDSIQVYSTDRTRAVGSREQKLKRLTEAQACEDWQFPDGLKATNNPQISERIDRWFPLPKIVPGRFE